MHDITNIKVAIYCLQLLLLNLIPNSNFVPTDRLITMVTLVVFPQSPTANSKITKPAATPCLHVHPQTSITMNLSSDSLKEKDFTKRLVKSQINQ